MPETTPPGVLALDGTEPVSDESVFEEGNADRLFLGIDGTMGDAQDVNHPFIASVHGEWCRVCGLAKSYRRHVDE